MSKQIDDHPAVRISVDQCLFGYRQGHRLLTSSRKIPTDVIQTFLGRTDATVDSLAKSTLLQGFPVPAANAYAIARTWPDRRENARSGTVLTHLLLVKMPDLGFEGVIAPLLNLLKADPNDQDETDFSRPVEVFYLVPDCSPLISFGFGEHDLIKLLEQVYGSAVDETGTLTVRKSTALTVNTQAAERLLAALWEQQWPRLRRSFSFVVGQRPSRESRLMERYPADLMLIATTDRSPDQSLSLSQPQPWVNPLAQDLIVPGSLRKFLRINGADLKETRSAMAGLVELYKCFESPIWNRTEYQQGAKTILSRYRNENEGKALKRQLLELPRWLERPGFRATEFIEIWLNFARQEFTFDTIDWSRLIQIAKIGHSKKLVDLVVSTTQDDELSVSEEFRNTYLELLTIPELLPLTEAWPLLFYAALRLHPQWLEEPRLWTDFRSRHENLASAIFLMANDGPLDLKWVLVVENMLNATEGLHAIELLQQVPYEALERFLETLYTRTISDQWLQGLTGRKSEVMEWIATQSIPPIQLLLWICQHLDYLDMWRPALSETWMRVAVQLSSYASNERTWLATHALCTMVGSRKMDGAALLGVLEIGRDQIVHGNVTGHQRHYLNDHLPRLQRYRDDWDLGKRLDLWAVEALNRLGLRRSVVERAFQAPKKADRLLKKLKEAR